MDVAREDEDAVVCAVALRGAGMVAGDVTDHGIADGCGGLEDEEEVGRLSRHRDCFLLRGLVVAESVSDGDAHARAVN